MVLVIILLFKTNFESGIFENQIQNHEKTPTNSFYNSFYFL